MRKWFTYILLVGTLTLCLQSCLPPSTTKIEHVFAPNRELINHFDVEVSGKLIYQFYQKYGFTDDEEQHILISIPNETIHFPSNLPIDSLNTQMIEIRKFHVSKFNLDIKKDMYSDILLKSIEFNNLDSISIQFQEGSYSLIQTDTSETLLIYDQRNNLLYIESIKRNE